LSRRTRGARIPESKATRGQSRAWRASSSEFDLFRERQCIIDFDAEVANGAFQRRMSAQKLSGSKVAGPAVDLAAFVCRIEFMP
jgi:hypothetical protein